MRTVLMIVCAIFLLSACNSSPGAMPALTSDGEDGTLLLPVDQDTTQANGDESKSIEESVASPPAFSPDLKETAPAQIADMIGSGRPVVLEFFAFW